MTISMLVKAMAAASILLTTASFAQSNLTFPKVQNETDAFAKQLLVNAIKRTGTSSKFQAFDRALSSTGVIESLKHREIDVAWLPAEDAQHQSFIAINIPVFNGALSYYQVHANKYQSAAEPLSTPADFRHKHIGLQKQDGNFAMLQNAGYQVSGAKNAASLKAMLEGGRFDLALIPLFASSQSGTISESVDTSTTLIFASNPYFFAVHKSRPDLANIIKRGLETLHNSGEMEQYMENVAWMQAALSKLQSGQFSVLEIDNANGQLSMQSNTNKLLQPSSGDLLGARLIN